MTDKLKLPNYGGQALIEGVLMRGPDKISAAFRLPDNSILQKVEDLPNIYRAKIFILPFFRGLTLLWDALVLGYKYLMVSANYQVEENEKIDKKSFAWSLIVSLFISILVFFVGPGVLSKWIGEFFDWIPLVRNIFEGLLRLLVIFLYLIIIGNNKEISRVFQYHGAEHKTINAYESGVELTPENISSVSRYHPRCGTSFTLTLVIFSIIIFVVLGDLPMHLIIITRILFLPLIAMLAYEYIRFLSKNMDVPLIRYLSYPNMLLQGLTTREPDRDVLEVAIAAFKGLQKPA